MKTTRILMLVLATSLILAACRDKDNENPVNPQNGEIRLSSGVTALTRASFAADTQIVSGEQVSVYVDETGSGQKVYGKNDLTPNGSGGFTGGTTMFYPASGNSVDIFAIHPAVAGGSADADFPSAALAHSVRASQTVVADYAASDLLFSQKKSVARGSATVPLTFYHMLSKLEVALKSGDGAPDLSGSTVTVESTKLKVSFAPSKTADIANVSTGAAARAAMVTLPGDASEAAPITIGNDASIDLEGSPVYNEAVIVPQTVTGGAPFIKVRLVSGTELIYKIPAGEGVTFESGKKYQYRITVNLSGLIVTSTIADWDPVNPVDGVAEMERE